MPLTPEQERALPVLDWLLDPPLRRSGKTLIMAIAMIRAACRNPNEWVQVVDHAVTTQRELRQVLDLVVSLVNRDNVLRDHLVINLQGHPRFRLSLPAPIPNWMSDLPDSWPPLDSQSVEPEEAQDIERPTWHDRIMADDD